MVGRIYLGYWRRGADDAAAVTENKQRVIAVSAVIVACLTFRVAVFEVPVAPNYWISPMLFKSFSVKSEVTLFSERPPVVQLTGVPALKVKSAKTKGTSVAL